MTKTYLVIGCAHGKDSRFCEAPPPSTCESPQPQSRATQRHEGQIGELGSLVSQYPSHPGSPAAGRSIIVSLADSLYLGHLLSLRRFGSK